MNRTARKEVGESAPRSAPRAASEFSPPAPSSSPSSPRWLQVDDAAAYMGGVSRKTVYAAVDAGMKVARLGDSGRRMLFNTAWIDEFLETRAAPRSVSGRPEAVTR
jgi:excisionase family DNA binding protein